MDNDLILRGDAIMALGEFPYNWNNSPEEIQEVSDFERCFNALEKVPAVDAMPVVHGKWELVATEHNAYRWQVDAVCSCCGFVKQGVWGGFFPDAPSEVAESAALRYAGKVKLPRYCETCGAKMDGERREADGKDD